MFFWEVTFSLDCALVEKHWQYTLGRHERLLHWCKYSLAAICYLHLGERPPMHNHAVSLRSNLRIPGYTSFVNNSYEMSLLITYFFKTNLDLFNDKAILWKNIPKKYQNSYKHNIYCSYVKNEHPHFLEWRLILVVLIYENDKPCSFHILQVYSSGFKFIDIAV